MADEKIKISELTSASQSEFTDGALLALDVEDQNSATGFSTKSGLLARLIAYIKTKLTAADIPYSSGVSVADKLDSLSTTDIKAVKGSYSGIKGVYGGYISGSKNYFDFLIPFNTNGLTSITNVSFTSISVLTANGRSDNPFSSYSVDVTPMGLFVDCRFSSTQAASISGVVTFEGMAFTAS